MDLTVQTLQQPSRGHSPREALLHAQLTGKTDCQAPGYFTPGPINKKMIQQYGNLTQAPHGEGGALLNLSEGTSQSESETDVHRKILVV